VIVDVADLDTRMRPRLFLSGLDFLTTVLAGHGYDVGGSLSRESDGDDEIAGLSLPWILAAGSLALVTAGVLVWLSPNARRRARTVAPKALIVMIIAAPLVAWTASADSDGKRRDLTVERSTALTGRPELLISLGEDDLNALKTTGGKRTVRVECVGRDGRVVIDAKRKWPFVNERGYDYPHTHLVADRTQVQRADRCRLWGTRVRLQADVEGALPR
jgi:hypothetical protein